jgi:membrane protease YdiL (CAAX protease family)
VSVFVALTFLWTWSVNLPQLAVFGAHHVSGGATTLASFAPSIVAVALVLLLEGRIGLRLLFGRLSVKKLRPLWLILAFVAPPVVAGISFFSYQVLSGRHPILSAWQDLLVGTLVLIPLTGLFEELGWRGLMLSTLQARMGALRATVLVALAWGLWHVPMYLRSWNEGSSTPLLIVLFVAGTFPLAAIFTALYNVSGGRLLPVIVLHASIDASVGFFLGPIARGDLRAFEIWLGIVAVIGGLLAARGLGEVKLPAAPPLSR